MDAFSRRRHRHGTQVRKGGREREGIRRTAQGGKRMDVERGGKADRKNIRGGWVVGWTRGEKMRRAKKGDGMEREDDGKNGEKRKNQINRRTWRIRGWSASR